jgi:DNA-binding protein H-NS
LVDEPAWIDSRRRAFVSNKLESSMEQINGEARDRLIRWLRRRMEEYGITDEALAASVQADNRAAREVQYRDAYGNTWDGQGDLPDWLRRAVAAGQQVDHFRCES